MGNRVKLIFLYNSDYAGEVLAWQKGEVPGHRLFGFGSFLANEFPGYEAATLVVKPQILKFLYKTRSYKLFQALWLCFNQKKYEVIVATHESCSFVPLFFKKIKLLNRPLVILSVALLREEFLSGFRNKVLRFLLSGAEQITTYTSAQLLGFTKVLGLTKKQVSFLPLCVDQEFFKPSGGKAGNYILAAGTNRGKDFLTLIEAVRNLPYPVRIITDESNIAKLKKIRLPKNVKLELGHRPIRELRAIYAGARLIVIPLFETPFSTGQTVTLENMAMGKTVIASRVSSLVDYLEDNKNGSLVEPKETKILREKIKYFWHNKTQAARLGKNARAAVERKYNLSIGTKKLLEIIKRIG